MNPFKNNSPISSKSFLLTLLIIAMALSPSPQKTSALTTGPDMIKDINPTGSSNPSSSMIIFKGVVYFSADDGVHGRELWRSDGTPGGTYMLKDINPGIGFSNPQGFVISNHTLFFQAGDDTNGVELWKTKGKRKSTRLVKNIRPGIASSSPGNLANINEVLFFTAYSHNDSQQYLWKSDGTHLGTKLIKDINTSPGLFTDGIVSFLGKAYFAAFDSTNGIELWESNGFAGGTKLVKDINTGSANSSPMYLTVFNGTLYFSAADAANGTELFSSDGFPSGTGLFKSFYPGTTSSFPAGFTIFNNELFMSAVSGNGREMWKTNGDPTVSGTFEILNINPLAANSNPAYFTPVENTLFFRANDGTNGRELWKTNGTFNNGSIVKDINGGSESNPSELTNLNGKLYFVALESANGFELWESDGTSLGTNRITNINPGAGSANISGMTVLKNGLIFSADDGTHGQELWYYKPTRIFADGFESGNTNAWSGVVNAGFEDTAICKLCVVKKGAIHGTHSLKVRIPNRKPHFLIDATPSAETKYHASFRIKLGNTLVMDNLNKFTVFKGMSGTQSAFSLQIRRKDTIYQIRAVIRNNLGNNLATQWTPLPVKPTNIEIEWEALPDFGFINLYINGNLKRTRGGISNDSFTIDAVQLGITQKIKAIFNINGSFILDNFDSDNYIVYN